DGIFTQHVWPQNQLPAPRVHPRIGGDFSWRYGFLSLTLRATNAVFFADFAPPKASKPLIQLVYFGNGRDMPRPQHSRPGRQFREGPWRHPGDSHWNLLDMQMRSCPARARSILPSEAVDTLHGRMPWISSSL